MGRTCSTHGRREVLQSFLWDDLKEGEHWEDLRVDVIGILKFVLKK